MATPVQTGAEDLRVNVNKWRKHDRERLLTAHMQHQAEVMLVIASARGANKSVAAHIEALGGAVRYRDDDVDYLRVRVPIEHAEEIGMLSDVAALNVDGDPLYRTGMPEDAATHENLISKPFQTPVIAPTSNTPAQNPYLPTQDIGAPQFIAKHPTFDGRGVTIGIFEAAAADLLSPQLQIATTLDGKPTHKVVDIINAFDPVDDERPEKVELEESVTTSERGTFTYRSVAYVAPSQGHYQIGFFNERSFFTEGAWTQGGDLNRDRNPPNSSGLFAVLWNKETNSIWVDTNQDHDFTNEMMMTDYNVHHDLGLFGKDDPKTPIRETSAFIIKTDAQRLLIYVIPTISSHATGTTSIAAGRGFFKGKMDGVAPGAQIIYTLLSGMKGMIEGMIMTMKDRRVDIVSVQVALGMRLNDGNSVFSIICDRLIEQYDKPIIGGASNYGPGVNTVGEMSNGEKVISVGGYISRNTWRSNYAVTAARDGDVMQLSSCGPREDGGFKPDIIAPAAAIMSDNAMYSNRKSPYSVSAINYILPAGYYATHGTSFAAPMVAGAAALLISAAKQSGISYKAERLSWALRSTARFITNYQAYEQGNGLINVRAAWESLKNARTTVTIIGRAPVKTLLSPYLKQPNQGFGLYEREGWATGQSDQRSIHLTRMTGSLKPVSYKLKWLGNDNTFSSPQIIVLPLRKSVAVPITISPKTPGIHSAILNLTDANDGTMVYQSMNTVIAAEQFTARDGFTITHTGQIEYPNRTSYFFNVPADTAAFKIQLQTNIGSSVWPRLLDPTGKHFSPYFFFSNAGANPQTGGKASQAIINPEPGVWELVIDNGNFELDNDRTADRAKAEFTVKASIARVNMNTSLLVVDPNNTKQIYAQAVTFSNPLSDFTGGVANSPMGSMFITCATLRFGAPRIYEIDVPPGATRLTATINRGSDKAADLDLYLYNCTQKQCVLNTLSAGSGTQEAVSVPDPAPGKWKAVIDPVSLPSQEITVAYMDVFTHPAFGVIESNDQAAVHLSGTTWKEQVNLHVTAMPIGQRSLGGLLEVVTASSETTGYVRGAPQKMTDTPTIDPIQSRLVLGTAVIKGQNKRLSAIKSR